MWGAMEVAFFGENADEVDIFLSYLGIIANDLDFSVLSKLTC